MREANKYDTKYVLILGGSELENGVATVRPMGVVKRSVSIDDDVAARVEA